MNRKPNRQKTTRNGTTDAIVKRIVLKTEMKQKHVLCGVNCFEKFKNTFENKQRNTKTNIKNTEWNWIEDRLHKFENLMRKSKISRISTVSEFKEKTI